MSVRSLHSTTEALQCKMTIPFSSIRLQFSSAQFNSSQNALPCICCAPLGRDVATERKLTSPHIEHLAKTKRMDMDISGEGARARLTGGCTDASKQCVGLK